jgi:hypothetical protein
MIPAKYLISNLFRGVTSLGDLIKNFQNLCYDNLNYRHINSFQQVQTPLSFTYSIIFDDSSSYGNSSIYVIATDYAHFAKTLILGIGKKDGLVVEAGVEGWISHSSMKESIKKLQLNNMRIFGYGKLWDTSPTETQLRESIYKKLKIPKRVKLKILSEDQIKKAVEKFY